MDREIFQKILQLKPELEQRFGITKIALFGSCARGDANMSSDIDIVILDMTRKNGFLIAKAKRFLSEKLNREVDIGIFSAMNPYVKKVIEKEMVNVE